METNNPRGEAKIIESMEFNTKIGDFWYSKNREIGVWSSLTIKHVRKFQDTFLLKNITEFYTLFVFIL